MFKTLKVIMNLSKCFTSAGLTENMSMLNAAQAGEGANKYKITFLCYVTPKNNQKLNYLLSS